jgi:hypothetical protein
MLLSRSGKNDLGTQMGLLIQHSSSPAIAVASESLHRQSISVISSPNVATPFESPDLLTLDIGMLYTSFFGALVIIKTKLVVFFVCFWHFWGFNLGLCTCKAGALLLAPHL